MLSERVSVSFVDPPVDSFAAALCSASESDDGKFLHVNMPLLGQLNHPKSLFIRDCYRKLYQTLVRPLQQGYRLLLTGTPGIGKSIGGLYLAHAWIQQAWPAVRPPTAAPLHLRTAVSIHYEEPLLDAVLPVVIYANLPGGWYYWLERGRAISLTAEQFQAERNQLDGRLVIMDAKGGSDGQPVHPLPIVLCRAIGIASPRSAAFNDFQKEHCFTR